MINFNQVRTEWYGPLTMRVEAGALVKVVAASREASLAFTRTLTGLAKPFSGSALLFGEDLYSIPEEDYIRLMSRVGVAQESGGMISNLYAWENVALPAMYHGNKTWPELETFTEEAMTGLGIDRDEAEKMMAAPIQMLKPWQGKILRMIRAYSMDPDLVVLEDVTTGLPEEIQRNAVQWALRLHRERNGRATVFVCQDESALKSFPAQTIYLASVDASAH